MQCLYSANPSKYLLLQSRAILDVDETFKEDPVDDQGAFGEILRINWQK